MVNQRTKNGDTSFTQAWAEGPFGAWAEIGRDNMDAFLKASSIAAKSYGKISQKWLNFTQHSVEQGAEAAKAVMDCRTVQDAAEAQADFSREAFDRYVAETNEISELAAKAAGEAIAPLQKRLDDVVGQCMKSAS